LLNATNGSKRLLKLGLSLTTPSAALRWLRDSLLMPQPPLLAKEGKKAAARLQFEFIHSCM